MGCAAEAEIFKDCAFPFEISHDSYHQVNGQKIKPVTFMADELGDVMYQHEAMHQPDAWGVSQANDEKDNKHGTLMQTIHSRYMSC